MSKLSEMFKQQIRDYPGVEDFEEGANYALDTVSPKIAIDFAEWCSANYIKRTIGNMAMEIKGYRWYKKRSTESIDTPEQLFAIFLQTYKP